MEALRNHYRKKELISALSRPEEASKACEELIELVGYFAEDYIEDALLIALKEKDFRLASLLYDGSKPYYVSMNFIIHYTDELIKEANDDAVKWLVETSAERPIARVIKGILEGAIKYNRFELAKWAKAKSSKPFKIYADPKCLVADAESVFRLIEWGQKVGGELDARGLLMSAAETGCWPLLKEMESLVGGRIESANNPTDRAHLAASALKSKNKKFASEVLNLLGITFTSFWDIDEFYSWSSLLREICDEYYTEILDTKINPYVKNSFTRYVYYESNNIEAMKACYEKTGFDYWHFTEIIYDHYTWNKEIAYWVVDTFGFNPAAHILVEAAREKSAEEAELLLQKLINIEPNAIELFQASIKRQLGRYSYGEKATEWVVDRVGITQMGDLWVSALERILTTDENVERLKWYLGKFQPPVMGEETCYEIYDNALETNPEKLEILYSAGIRPSNPGALIEDIRRLAHANSLTLGWLVEKFTLTAAGPLTRRQMIEAAEELPEGHINWLLRWSAPFIENNYILIALGMHKLSMAEKLAKYFASQLEGGKEKYQPLIDACMDRDWARAVDICRRM